MRTTAWGITALLASSAAFAAPPEPARIATAPAFHAPQLTALPREGWLTNGGNLANQRFSPLTQINRDNVAGLKAVWRASLRGSGMEQKHSGQAQTLVHEGTLYTVTGSNDVFAISVASGEVLWEYKANLEAANVVPCCGWVSRGVGLGDGKVFVGQLDNKVVALDQHTGKVVWSVQSETLRDAGYTITSAPLYYDGLVIVGHAGGELAIRGRLKAFDAKTGKLRWVFHTIPGPGELGHDTWPADNDAWTRGGGAIWQTPAVDPQLGLIYVSTDNPAPDLNGSMRAGDNLFTDSVVALDAKTGKYRWHYQEIHHDLWDYGSPSPVVLFDALVDGKPRKGLANLSKSGYAYILDRLTGQPLVGIVERPVMQSAVQKTAATQPIPLGDELVPHFIDIAPNGFDLVNEGRTYTPFEGTPVIYKPRAGVNWPPSSYDPDTHLLFVCANDAIGVLTSKVGTVELPKTVGEHYLGGSFGRVDASTRGIFAALDVTTNRLAWRRQWSTGCSGGSVNTAGGLLFIGRSDGKFQAYDKRDGRLVWEFQTDAGVSAPASVFEWHGNEYIAVLAAGSFYAGNVRGDGVWLFALNGTMGPAPPPGSTSAATSAAPLIAPMPAGPANLRHGQDVYLTTCQPCHGPDGQGSHDAGAPLTTRLTAAMVYDTATAGRKNMPSFRDALKPEELRDVAAFITQELVTRAPAQNGMPSPPARSSAGSVPP